MGCSGASTVFSLLALALISQALQAGVPWFGHVLCWQEDTIDVYLSAVWEPHYREAWVLISDQPAGRRRVREYAWRMPRDRNLRGYQEP
jgi:hypothetical protein